jgi:hypothetical protein
MKTSRIAIALAALIVCGIGAAVAGTTGLVSPRTGDIVFPFSPPSRAGAGGSIGDTTWGGMAPVNGNLSYTKVPARTGFSYTFGNFQADMLFEPTVTLDTGTVTMAPAPIDGARACIFSTQIVTSLTLNANAGQSINNALTALAANVRHCYLYSVGDKTWDLMD